MLKLIKLPALTLFLLITLLFLHVVAMDNHLYLHIPFFDIITHFLGGACIGLSALYIFRKPKYIIPIALIAGIGWEIFEVYFDIAGWPVESLQYKIDTIKDIFVDLLGAIVVWIAIKFRK